MKTLRNFIGIVDVHTLLVIVLSVSVTWLCDHFGFEADIPTGLIGIAIIFPIVFSINAAYRRREEALKYFASLKAHAMAIYYAHRDWVPEGGEESHAPRAREEILELLNRIREYFRGGMAENDGQLPHVYERFSGFSRSMESMRASGLSGGQVSRANQYLRAMMIEFERMRNILAYRTPVTLRAYSKVFLNAFPILFGPYFAYLCDKHYTFVGYGVAVLYSLVLVSLDNIQENLEIPFDAKGKDDLRLDIRSLYEPVLR